MGDDKSATISVYKDLYEIGTKIKEIYVGRFISWKVCLFTF